MKRDTVLRGSLRTGAESGFTLIEIMLVVVLIGILATAVVIGVKGRTVQAACNTCRVTIGSVASAINLFEMDNGTYPGSLTELVNNTGQPTWRGPYVPRVTDPWGTELAFVKTENSFKITSAGPDKQMGTADDLTN